MEQLSREFTDFCKHLYDYWRENNLWTWRWWLTAAASVIPWILWLFIRKKESTQRLLCAGLFTGAIAVFLDILGGGLELWAYTVRPLPIISSFLPWDISILPVVTMVFLQFYTKTNPFIKAAVYSFLGAFIFEPASIWLGFVKEPHWSSFYSFPILYLIYMLSHRIAAGKSYAAIREVI